MIAHIGYNLMISRINKVVNKMEAHAIEFLDILEEPTH
jgi:biopolymer transport protein ExbB